MAGGWGVGRDCICADVSDEGLGVQREAWGGGGDRNSIPKLTLGGGDSIYLEKSGTVDISSASFAPITVLAE